MEWLNYHHLYYFWMVSREGSIAAACRRLLLSPATVSAQIRDLEEVLGEKLFRRLGRNLVLTEFGRLAARYAEEIFGLGREFIDVAKGRTLETTLRFRLGVDDVLPKLLVSQVLQTVFRLPQAVRVLCVEGTQEHLVPRLAVNDLDLVLSDAGADPAIKVRTFSRLLGEFGIAICAEPVLARRLRQHFPESLDGAPALLPTANTSLRRIMDTWFESIGVRPRILGEFEDAALLNACGHRGLGFFAAPGLVAREFATGKGVQIVGALGKVRMRLYALSVERRVKHPAAVALVEGASRALREVHRKRTMRPETPK